MGGQMPHLLSRLCIPNWPPSLGLYIFTPLPKAPHSLLPSFPCPGFLLTSKQGGGTHLATLPSQGHHPETLAPFYGRCSARGVPSRSAG